VKHKIESNQDIITYRTQSSSSNIESMKRVQRERECNLRRNRSRTSKNGQNMSGLNHWVTDIKWDSPVLARTPEYRCERFAGVILAGRGRVWPENVRTQADFGGILAESPPEDDIHTLVLIRRDRSRGDNP